MKRTTSTIILMITICSYKPAAAQKCYIPKPMTTEQKAAVRGVWKGSYVQDGKVYPIVMTLYNDNDSICRVDKPPVTGRETGEQIRFCEGGEFHFKKYIGDMSYEFQGIPRDGKWEGLLTIRNRDKKVGNNGRMSLEKQ